MNRKDLATALVDNKHFTTRSAAMDCIKDFTQIVEKELAAGNEVDLYGFGKFFTALQKGKTGKVPGTEKTYTTQDKIVPRFKASKVLKTAIAAGR